MVDFIRICARVHRKMERREEDKEVKEEKGCDDDDTEGGDDDETAERSDDEIKDVIEAARDGGGGEGEGSDGHEEQNDQDGETCSVKKVSPGRTSCPGQKSVPGIIYLGHIPPRLRPKHLRNLLSPYGEVGRIFLQPEGRKASFLPTVKQLFYFFFCLKKPQGSQRCYDP